ncbi:DNA-directed RNA polymerase II large subunit [Panicum miliaceum]|uniref:DNA-directed RNA polymerase II large subunit n=1 Tax=Panicum miliaceum TaxID=4540 RepID=A0A3L6PLM4_PANMI|nr:DNA-directed RNA polymerase II large subunit [Panicum miliaceum]
MAVRASSTGLVVLCLTSLLVPSLADDTSGSHGAGRKMTPGMVAEEKDPPMYTPTVPSYTPTVPTYRPTVPSYTPNVPTYRPTVPSYTPNVPTYRPTVPSYRPPTYTPPTYTDVGTPP